MSQEEFNYFLSWVLLLNGIPPFYSAFVCALWLNLVKRRFSKIVCLIGLIMFLAIGTVRVFTSYEFDNQTIRILNGLLFVVGGIVANVILTWSYLRRRKESKLLTPNELERLERPFADYIRKTVDDITPETVSSLVDRLSLRDASRLLKDASKLKHKFNNLRF